MFISVLSVLAIGGLAVGIFCFFRPESAIELQRRFYLTINWRIEPVSWEKEVRNTRAMGLFLVVFSIITFWLVFSKPAWINSCYSVIVRR